MVCKKCGKENKEGAKFCKYCGEELVVSNMESKGKTEDSLHEEISKESDSQNSKGPDSRREIIPIVIAAGLLALVILGISIGMKPKINLEEFLTVDVSGYDGYGHASAYVDWSKVEEKYGNKITLTKKAKDEYGGFTSYMSPIDMLESGVSVRLNTLDSLSNGDTLSYTWRVDDELSDYLNCKLEYKNDGTYTVSGLSPIETFDAFSDLSVSFAGIAPSGSVTLDYTGSELKLFDFNIDKESGLKNGDKIKVSISSDNINHYAQSLGKIPDKFEKEYEVSGLDEYIDGYSDISDEILTELKKEAEDKVMSYTASYNAGTMTDLQYEGYVFNSVKDGSGYVHDYNSLFLIYSGKVSSSEGRYRTSKIYYPVRFDNFLKTGDEVQYSGTKEIVGNTYLSTFVSTYGYINPINCFADLVTANKNGYNTEAGDGFEVFSDYNPIKIITDINEEFRKELQDEAADIIDSYVASNYSESIITQNISLKGEYLLVAKNQGSDFEMNNKYIIVYSANIAHKTGKFDDTVIYFPVEYDGLVTLPNNENMVTSYVGILGQTSFPNILSSTKGYLDGKDMFAKIVTANRDKYVYEVSEGLKEFGE